jgi:predicted nucleic acid-binding protein
MTRLVLDSTFLVDHLRGLPDALARWHAVFERGDEPIVTETVVCEVGSGLRSADVPAFEALIRPVEFIQPGPDTAMLAGRWRADLRTSGRTLSLADALIAAAAVSLDAAVLTRNLRDFALTPARVETY